MRGDKKGWKAVQAKRQSAKKTKLALIALGIILGIFFLAQVFKFTQTLFSPWQMSTQSHRAYKWNGDFNINILLRSDSISLISYNPQNEKITVINIPDETYIEASKGFGSWQVRSIFPLGGDELLKSSLTNFFGVPIDGFLDSTSLNSLLDKNPLSVFSILPKVKTDLTLFELIHLKMGLASVRFDKVNKIELQSLGLLEKAKLADGTEILSADPVKLDSLSTHFLESVIQSEHKSIAIFNGTNHPGIAQKAARLIANIGGDVIIVSNGEKKYEKTQIFGEESKTLQRLKQIFNVSGNIEALEQPSSRAQINVILGEDYFNSL